MKRYLPWITVGAATAITVVILAFVFRSTTVAHDRSVSHKIERSSARSAALVNYRNALEGCEGRGNEGRENTLTLARILSKDPSPERALPARRVVRRILGADYSLPTGAIECVEAIDKP